MWSNYKYETNIMPSWCVVSQIKMNGKKNRRKEEIKAKSEFQLSKKPAANLSWNSANDFFDVKFGVIFLVNNFILKLLLEECLKITKS